MAEIERMENGTYAGECLIDCFETVSVTRSTVRYSLTSRVPDDAHPDVQADEPVTGTEWNELVSRADLDALASLPTKIGIPDAGDRGGEFLEVAADGSVTRVDFERGDTPAAIAPLLEPLRARRAALRSRHGR